MSWQLAEAKNKFSEIVDRAIKEGPQSISRRGKDRVVLLSGEEYEKLRGKRPDFKDFLLSAPYFGELELEREDDTGRTVEL